MNFEFATATRIVFGSGTLREAGALAKKFGSHALVVTGGNPQRAEGLFVSLAGHGVAADRFSIVIEPEIAAVELMVEEARRGGYQVVIGVGGGSVIDTAKTIAAMLTNDGVLIDYLEVIGRGKALTNSSAPFIAIPTTAGTGSEVTRNAVLASPEHKVKVSLRSPLMLPRVAVVDPELTYDLPPALTASTGLDAITQLIEPYVCARANPMTDGLCAEGLRRAARSLRVAFADGGNQSAREDMAVASLHGGLALANAGLGAVHGFAGPIGGMFPAAHGAVCAALLPHVMAANLHALRERERQNPALGRYVEVARILTADNNATADQGVAWVRQLVSDLRIPPLRVYGIGPEHIADLVANAAKSSSMKANPIVLTAEEMTTILRQAW